MDTFMKISRFVIIAAALVMAAAGCKKFDSKKDNIVPVTGIKLDYSEETLVVGGQLQLHATLEPAKTTVKSISWTSDKPGVASVSNNGLVKAESLGNATVTATAGSCTASCTIHVINEIVHVTSISLDPDKIVLMPGGEQQVSVKFTPSTATNHNVTWSSGNNNIATVTDGKVKAVGYGTTSIKAVSEDGGKEASATVKVVQPYTSVVFTSPDEDDDHWDADAGKFIFLEGEQIQLAAKGFPEEAEDDIVFCVSGWYNNNYLNYYDVTPEGLLSLVKYYSNVKVRARSKANEEVYADLVFDIKEKPTGITLNETGHSGRTAHICVGKSRTYAISVEPATAPQKVTILEASSSLNGCSASISGKTLTINVPSTVTPSTSSSTRKMKLTLRAAGNYKETIEFILTKLDPWEIKLGDIIDKSGNIHDGGYRGNGIFVDSEDKPSYPNSIVAWVGSSHTTEDPFWASYKPTTGIKDDGGAPVHGIAIPVNIEKLYRTTQSSGEVYYTDSNNDNFILDSGNKPKWLRDDTAKQELMKSTSTKHSAYMNTCCHVYTNAGRGSSYEILPFNYFYNDLTKKPSKDLGESNSMDSGNYVFANDFTDNLNSSGFNARALNETTSYVISGKYMTPWLCPTIADMYSIFVGGTVPSAGAFETTEIYGNGNIKERVAALKNAAHQYGNELTYLEIPWWVANESGRDGGTLYLCQFKVTGSTGDYIEINRKAKRTDRAFIFPIRYF